MKDPDEPLREIQEERRKNFFFLFKRLLRLAVGLKLIQLKRLAINQCVKCGANLVMYHTRNKRIKVCEHCDRINPDNIVTETVLLSNGKFASRKVCAGYLKRCVFAVIIIFYSRPIQLFFANRRGKNERNDSGDKRHYIRPTPHSSEEF